MWREGGVDIASWRERYAADYYGAECAAEIAALLAEYAECTAKYGPNEDDRAGEQIWHHPVRELLCAWVRGETDGCVESLVWLTGEVPFPRQIETLGKIAQGCLPAWEALYAKCAALLPSLAPNSACLFRDTLLLHITLQKTGAEGALLFCQSYTAFIAGRLADAFVLAHKAQSCYEAASAALSRAGHGKWEGYYRGDCLTDVRLTASSLASLVSYLRVRGDGPGFHKWERAYLSPPHERGVALLSCKARALSDGELAERLAAACKAPCACLDTFYYITV